VIGQVLNVVWHFNCWLEIVQGLIDQRSSWRPYHLTGTARISKSHVKRDRHCFSRILKVWSDPSRYLKSVDAFWVVDKIEGFEGVVASSWVEDALGLAVGNVAKIGPWPSCHCTGVKGCWSTDVRLDIWGIHDEAEWSDGVGVVSWGCLIGLFGCQN